jgi:hypothetical protein
MKELKFIHITKTGGTSIEDIGIKNNIRWGRFHKKYGYWHKFFPDKNKLLKLKYDWFVVVRNPYDRILSEYYCKWGGIGNMDISNNIIDDMNKFLIDKINNRSIIGDHYSEQYKYIDNDNNIKIHILKFENLKEEFDLLMKTYNINLTLDIVNNKSQNKIFTINDFSDELINLINIVYEKDFEMFNYEKILLS